jgi:arylsulfatase A-like enzyme
MYSVCRGIAFMVASFLCISAIRQPPRKRPQRNVIIFVADGLRYGSVNPQDTPALYGIRKRGVDFQNGHALFPTFTTANASAIATGHAFGDTADCSNTIYAGYKQFAGVSAVRARSTTWPLSAPISSAASQIPCQASNADLVPTLASILGLPYALARHFAGPRAARDHGPRFKRCCAETRRRIFRTHRKGLQDSA